MQSNDASSETSFFTGGAFDKQETEAAAIASKIRSVKDLGWTSNVPRRKGSTRPRHRAFGGSGEKPVQLKPNYDETSEMCVEKWLTQEDFYRLTKSSGPAADTVFVALAKGAAFAERDVCESLISKWQGNGPKKSFDEAAFLQSVKEGRTELAIGWALFAFLAGGSASCIIFPTNPLAKGLEAFINAVLYG